MKVHDAGDLKNWDLSFPKKSLRFADPNVGEIFSRVSFYMFPIKTGKMLAGTAIDAAISVTGSGRREALHRKTLSLRYTWVGAIDKSFGMVCRIR